MEWELDDDFDDIDEELLKAMELNKRLPFDVEALTDAVYPSVPKVRSYQLEAARMCLEANALVCFSTGLGKTLVGACVMYNFYRWFPSALVVFVAPSRPLVTQQMSACSGIMGLPNKDMAELTGHITASKRTALWSQARAVFCTPQTLVNDIESGRCPAERIACIVVDEAHHATGQHAYVTSIAAIRKHTTFFRVIGLSATPGSSINAVQEVITNLHIARMLVKDSSDADVKPYVFNTKTDVVVVASAENIQAILQMLYKIIEHPLKRLCDYRALAYIPPSSMSKYHVVCRMNEYSQSNTSTGNRFQVIGVFGVLVSLLACKERLLKYGIANFRKNVQDAFIKESVKSRAKKQIRNLPEFGLMVRLADEYLQGASSQHPKCLKLGEVLYQHFSQDGVDPRNTRVIVFSQLRTSVEEIVEFLDKQRPLIKPMKFVGRAGLTQKEQMKIVQEFIEGECNVLVATSIGEEGLDIGEVDLIVCFDFKKSPISTTQRFGRTGRRRIGRCVVLLTAGKEELEYEANKNRSAAMIASLKSIAAGELVDGERIEFESEMLQSMLPDGVIPPWKYVAASVPAKHTPRITDFMVKRPRSGATKSPYISEAQVNWLSSNGYLLSDTDIESIPPISPFASTTYVARGELSRTCRIGHSSDTKLAARLIKTFHSKQEDNPEAPEMVFSLSQNDPGKFEAGPMGGGYDPLIIQDSQQPRHFLDSEETLKSYTTQADIDLCKRIQARLPPPEDPIPSQASEGSSIGKYISGLPDDSPPLTPRGTSYDSPDIDDYNFNDDDPIDSEGLQTLPLSKPAEGLILNVEQPVLGSPLGYTPLSSSTIYSQESLDGTQISQDSLNESLYMSTASPVTQEIICGVCSKRVYVTRGAETRFCVDCGKSVSAHRNCGTQQWSCCKTPVKKRPRLVKLANATPEWSIPTLSQYTQPINARRFVDFAAEDEDGSPTASPEPGTQHPISSIYSFLVEEEDYD